VARLACGIEINADDGCLKLQCKVSDLEESLKLADEKRDRLWCKALISLLGEGLSTDHIEIITRRVNEMRDGKHPSMWPER
jgi:hypothetical protein